MQERTMEDEQHQYHQHSQLKASSSTSSQSSSVSLSFQNLKSILKQSNLESEDSSYDSDCEVTESTHYDVSRTVSDTLGQEYDDYVTSTTNYEANQKTFLDEASSNIYHTRLEFARKLGYTEAQVKVALSKLGPSPSQNELLAELIQLDCSNSCSSTTSNHCTSSTSSNQHGPRNISPTGHCYGDESSLSSSSLTKPIHPNIVLRHIVIDGSNVAMSHGNNKTFSCRGIQLAVEYFKARGHKDITVFVPSFRKETPKIDDPLTDQEILLELEKDGHLVFTPSRTVGTKRLVCYDDRYILRLAVETDGVVVSNDNYRDLTIESPDFKRIVTERMLMYSFVNDRFMPPEDPLGRNGPTLDQLLSKTPLKSAPPCPYGRKCTYGTKCKYFHPIIKQSVSDSLRKQAALKSTQSLPINSMNRQIPISRTRSAVPLGVVNNPGGIGGGPLSSGGPNPPNPHKKLQRQLSINPVSDPRIRPSSNYLASSSSESNLNSYNSSSCSSITSSTYLSPFPTQPGLSEVWSPPPKHPLHQQQSGGAPFDDDRNRIYFHLVAIFPKHQVLHVMNLYPHENDPQVICKHIIKLFS